MKWIQQILGMSVLCLLRVKEKVRIRGFSSSALALSLGGTHSSQGRQRTANQAITAGCLSGRMSTWPLPSSSSREDKAVFLWGKCKKQFNLCLHLWPASGSCARTEAGTTHRLPNTDTYTSPVKPGQQALPLASCQASREAHWFPIQGIATAGLTDHVTRMLGQHRCVPKGSGHSCSVLSPSSFKAALSST